MLENTQIQQYPIEICSRLKTATEIIEIDEDRRTLKTEIEMSEDVR